MPALAESLMDAAAQLLAGTPGLPPVVVRKELVFRSQGTNKDSLPFAAIAVGKVRGEAATFGNVELVEYPLRIAVFQAGNLNYTDGRSGPEWVEVVNDRLMALDDWEDILGAGVVQDVEVGDIAPYDPPSLPQGFDVFTVDLVVTCAEDIYATGS